jgi:hypothetical protein
MIIYFGCTPQSSETQSCCDQNPEPKSDYTKKLKETNHFLDIETADKWIKRYQDYFSDTSARKRIADQNQQKPAEAPLTPATPSFPKESESFNRALIQQILCLDSCMGIRILFGINDNNEVRLLLGGIDQQGQLLYITDAGTDKQTGLKTTGRFLPPTKSGLGEMGQLP